MTKSLVSATLRVYTPSTSGTATADADQTVSGTDIESAGLTRRAQAGRDMGVFNLDNDDESYTNAVDIGDRVQWYTELQGEGSESLRWTGLVSDLAFDVGGGGTNDLKVTCDDFVFGILSRRHVTDRFDEVQASGTSSSVLNSILADEASEIGTSKIDAITTTVTREYQRTYLDDAVETLATKANAVAKSDGKDLDWSARGTIEAEWTLTADDRVGGFGSTLTDDDLHNDIIVDGPRATDVDIQQTSSDSTEVVSSSNRRTEQVDIRKDEVAAVEVDVVTQGSGDNLVIRLQQDDGSGSPEAVGDRSSDLARAVLPSGDLSDGFVKFPMPNHHTSRPDVHIIAESDGSTGQGVRYDSGSGSMAYKVYYYYDSPVSASDQASIDDYRRQDGHFRRETIDGDNEGTDLTAALLARHSDLSGTFKFDADSTRAHNLEPGQAITVDESGARATGEYLVKQVADDYDGRRNELTTTLSCETIETA